MPTKRLNYRPSEQGIFYIKTLVRKDIHHVHFCNTIQPPLRFSLSLCIFALVAVCVPHTTFKNCWSFQNNFNSVQYYRDELEDIFWLLKVLKLSSVHDNLNLKIRH